MDKEDVLFKIREEIKRYNALEMVGPYGNGRRIITCVAGQQFTNSHHSSES